MSTRQFLFPLVATTVLYGLWKVYRIAYRGLTSSIRNIPGLSTRNVFIGNLKELIFTDQAAAHEQYVKEYGNTFKFKALLWNDWLFTADVKAISHILKKDTHQWQKPMALGYSLQRILGPGVLLVDSDVHRKQRKILNPAFAPAEVKLFTETFLDKATKLRDIWTSQVQQNQGETRIEVLSWLSRAALDVIGETGFGYKFDALAEEPNRTSELHEAFKVMFRVGTNPSLIRLLRGLVSVMRYLPADRDLETEKAKKTMDRISKQLLAERKLALDPQRPDKTAIEGNDILSLLVRANASGAINQRLSDEHVLAQIPTFIIAGHETTSTGTAWVLFALAQDKAIQARLREELLSVPTENPTMDELNALSYLDAVVREAMRLHSPLPATARYPVEDDVLPLETPIIDKSGKVHHELRVDKEVTVLISIAMVNRLESIWGKDAKEFNPDRWSSLPEAAMSIPGVWGNTLSFLGGPRACIGYRFALIEMKALLFILIRAFEFELAVPVQDIIKRAEIVTRPILRTDPTGANQLPMLVRPVACY
ncbi:cytochrome P450 [Macrolepiota fuliginosa MF-IS2]|uniref:Cytochrome P450 n=1 Tax=Macrolepiota fuliginosa MF-IS2 TaxID=1400762 RepID=A0A9P6C9Z7_9AGAR|nr:cytochrome P450 [Macrolepiota fuliginosa MF-IS2]